MGKCLEKSIDGENFQIYIFQIYIKLKAEIRAGLKQGILDEPNC